VSAGVSLHTNDTLSSQCPSDSPLTGKQSGLERMRQPRHGVVSYDACYERRVCCRWEGKGDR